MTTEAWATLLGLRGDLELLRQRLQRMNARVQYDEEVTVRKVLDALPMVARLGWAFICPPRSRYRTRGRKQAAVLLIRLPNGSIKAFFRARERCAPSVHNMFHLQAHRDDTATPLKGITMKRVKPTDYERLLRWSSLALDILQHMTIEPLE